MKKTWIKVKRGLLQKKHRDALGVRVWLYFYMLDRANWDTGKITGWTDQDAADDNEMALRTVRDQRQDIEAAGYIACQQVGQHQVITIFDYVSPRSYDGQVLNPRGTGIPQTIALDFDDEVTAENALLNGYTKVLFQGDTKVATGPQGNTEGDTEGDPLNGTLPYTHRSHITQDRLHDAWGFAIGQLQGTIDRASFITYINPMKIQVFQDNTVHFFISNKYAADWIRSHSIDKEIERFMSGILRQKINVEITTVIKETACIQ